MNPSHAGHDVRAGTSTRSRSGHARADLLAIPHLPHAAPRARTAQQTASFAGLEKKSEPLWDWEDWSRATGQLVDWEGGGRDKAACKRLIERLKRWRTRL